MTKEEVCEVVGMWALPWLVCSDSWNSDKQQILLGSDRLQTTIRDLEYVLTSLKYK